MAHHDPDRAALPAPTRVIPFPRPRAVVRTRHVEGDVEVAGCRLRYIDVGPRDAPPLLLIHGLSSRLEEYDALVAGLAPRFRVLVPDLPGSGYSDKPDRPYTLRFLEDSLLGFLDALGVSRAYAGGGSLGGNLVLRLGHREPERFPRLVPWAPAGAWPRQWWARHLFRCAHPALWWPTIWLQSRFWYARGWHGRQAALRDTFEYYREVHRPEFVRMYFDLVLEQLEESLFQFAHRVVQPTLIAWGDQDHGMRMGEGLRELVRRMPRAHLHVFPGACHALANEVPAELARVVSAFLDPEPALATAVASPRPAAPLLP